MHLTRYLEDRLHADTDRPDGTREPPDAFCEILHWLGFVCGRDDRDDERIATPESFARRRLDREGPWRGELVYGRVQDSRDTGG